MKRLSGIVDLLAAAVDRNPDAIAVVDDQRRVTFGELQVDVARGTQALVDAGVRRGSTVAVSIGNGGDVLIAFFATMALGARWVGLNRALTVGEQCLLLSHCRVGVLLTDHEASAFSAIASLRSILQGGPDGSWRSAVARARPRWPVAFSDPLAPAAIAYTSGTTGQPKGVVHSQHNIALPGQYLMTTPDFGPNAIVGICLPLTTLNLIVVAALPALFAGRPCVFVPKLEAGIIAEWVRREGITNMSIPAPLLYDLATCSNINPTDLATLRCPRTGGAELPDETRNRYEARFATQVIGTYGLTEAPTVVAIEQRGRTHVPGASGKVVPYLDVHILTDAGQPASKGVSGEICLAPSQSGPWSGMWRPMLGYWRRPAETRVAMRDGVLHTGDIGYLDDEGNLMIRDRKSEVVNRGGANVYPTDVERVVREVPGVADCAVVGIPDIRLGQRVAAAVEPEEGTLVSVNAVIDHCRERLAKYKIPEVVIIINAMPRNPMGKIARGAVRALITNSESADV